MNEFEFDNGFEVLHTDNEYLDMKDAYKRGKKAYKAYGWEPCMVGYIPSIDYSNEVLQEHFINGWLYQQWIEEQDAISIRPRD